MRPADCLERLWQLARAELATASTALSIDERLRMSRFAVEYRTESSGTMPPAFRSIVESGRYDWRDGWPCIKLYRLPAACPQAINEPDLFTQPELDACILAYELGHFRADPRGALTQTPSAVRRAGLPLTHEQKATLLDDERAAWRLGRAILEQLGCDDLGWFDDFASEKTRDHESDLAAHRDEPVHPTAAQAAAVLAMTRA